ncbi:retrotransposon protein, putative, ty1-copia subclass [Tanacetum coccineum]
MPANQEHVHLVWPLWSDLRVIPTHGEFRSLVRPMAIFARSCLVDLNLASNAINARRLPLALLVYSLVRPLMTTTVVNNSVFRTFFEKQNITGPNFINWYHNLWIVLSVEDKLPFLEQPIPVMPVPPAGQVLPSDVLYTHSTWVKASKEIAGLMLITMDPDIQKNLEQLGAYDMLKKLKMLYVQQAEQELLQTVREFHACKQEEGQSVSSYVLKMKSYIDNLECLGHAMTQNLTVSLILVSLRNEYDSFVQNYNMHGIGKTMTELHAMLKLHEQTLPQKDAAPALHAIRAGRIQKNQKKNPHKAAKGNQEKGKAKMGYAPVPAPSFALKPKNPPTPKKDNPAKDAICHQCAEVGHWRRNCLVYLAELLKKKKLSQGASTSGIFTKELYSFPRTSWVYNTGCGTHICITIKGLRGSRKLKPGALSLYVGDGHRAEVEAIREFHLCLPSGLVLILHNCHYAPSITRGIISVSRLYDDDFVNHFDGNVLSVSRNNLVYFSAIPRDGIYEIDLSSSNTNDSFMYAISNKRAKLNLDSTLLWHCRLGHISKKCIEKLQHDGLLNSTDIKSFEKCVSYMSGKMVRKPYSHKVERAKEFYLTIPTPDVCESFQDLQYNELVLCHTPQAEESGQMQSMRENEVWDLVDLPPNSKTVGHKWLFKKKTDMDGAVHTYKARLLAKGFTQSPGIDYEETFSPVIDIRAIRIIIAIFAFYDYEIWQMDVKTAFLNGYLYEELYMEQSKGFVNPKFPNQVCNLKRSIMDLRKHLGNGINDLMMKLRNSNILIIRNNIPMLQDVNSYLERCFAIKDLGEATYILGIKIYRDRSKRLIGLCQSAYIEKILKRYFMENSKRGTIPMQEKQKLSKSQGASTPAEKQHMRNVPYASVIGSIIYLMDADDLKSQTEYVFVLNGGAVDWKSKKQILTIEERINMYRDNTGAIEKAKDHGVTKVARHFRVKLHYLRETIEMGDVRIEKVDTDDNLADPSTKALEFPKHSKLTNKIGMIPTSSLMQVRVLLDVSIASIIADCYLNSQVGAVGLYQKLLQTVREFHACKLEEGQFVSSYVLKMKSYIDNLERLGHAMTQNLANPPTHKKDNPAKDAICHQCGEVGHWRRKCHIYLIELLKKKKLSQGASTSGIFTIEHYSFPKTSWVYDTGCGTHICITTQGLKGSRKLKPGALSLGIISVSRLYDDGFVNRFDGNVLLVSKNNLVYFSAIPRDGIYEIDLSSSNTNDSSMYAISNKRAKPNLDSTLLWHCRLGHISKKRIEKLQHDGLLNSTDIKSFEKCVSCMSRKIARNPYSHQMERAKDLLGLIHTDVCDPFRTVSRQEASYFVTFTDNFSRYGYVYLLKHKHEVFETFKVFQKEVENQLGKTIKSLRSNRGDMVRSMMSQTTLPKSFWDYALESIALILNMVLTKKVDKTPYEVWHGQDLKLSYLKVWGCEALIKRDTLTKLDKLEPRSIKCIFVGYPKETMSLITQEASGSLEDLEIIQEEDTHPSIHELGDLGEPANYKAALLDPESDKWLNDMNVEMQSMRDNKV